MSIRKGVRIDDDDEQERKINPQEYGSTGNSQYKARIPGRSWTDEFRKGCG